MGKARSNRRLPEKERPKKGEKAEPRARQGAPRTGMARDIAAVVLLALAATSGLALATFSSLDGALIARGMSPCEPRRPRRPPARGAACTASSGSPRWCCPSALGAAAWRLFRGAPPRLTIVSALAYAVLTLSVATLAHLALGGHGLASFPAGGAVGRALDGAAEGLLSTWGSAIVVGAAAARRAHRRRRREAADDRAALAGGRRSAGPVRVRRRTASRPRSRSTAIAVAELRAEEAADSAARRRRGARGRRHPRGGRRRVARGGPRRRRRARARARPPHRVRGSGLGRRSRRAGAGRRRRAGAGRAPPRRRRKAREEKEPRSRRRPPRWWSSRSRRRRPRPSRCPSGPAAARAGDHRLAGDARARQEEGQEEGGPRVRLHEGGRRLPAPLDRPPRRARGEDEGGRRAGAHPNRRRHRRDARAARRRRRHPAHPAGPGGDALRVLPGGGREARPDREPRQGAHDGAQRHRGSASSRRSRARASWASRSRTATAPPSTCATSSSPSRSPPAGGFLPLGLGKNIEGIPYCVDLQRMPHLLIAGTTGSGKSVGLNTMICSLLYRQTPAEVRMIMVDPKMTELSIYEDIPHLLLPVVTDPQKAARALQWAVDEMERRTQILADTGSKDLKTYNGKVEKLRAEGRTFEDGDAPPPRKLVVVDEVAGETEEEAAARAAAEARDERRRAERARRQREPARVRGSHRAAAGRPGRRAGPEEAPAEAAVHRRRHRRARRPHDDRAARGGDLARPPRPEGARDRHPPHRRDAAPVHRRHHRDDQEQLPGPHQLPARLAPRLADHHQRPRRGERCSATATCSSSPPRSRSPACRARSCRRASSSASSTS